MPFGEFFGSAGSTATTTTVTPPLVAARTARRTLVAVCDEPTRLAEETAPAPSWSPMCAPLRLPTRVTSCHFDEGKPDTADWSARSGLPPLEPVTWTDPTLVPSVTPVASCARTVHADE